MKRTLLVAFTLVLLAGCSKPAKPAPKVGDAYFEAGPDEMKWLPPKQ